MVARTAAKKAKPPSQPANCSSNWASTPARGAGMKGRRRNRPGRALPRHSCCWPTAYAAGGRRAWPICADWVWAGSLVADRRSPGGSRRRGQAGGDSPAGGAGVAGRTSCARSARRSTAVSGRWWSTRGSINDSLALKAGVVRVAMGAGGAGIALASADIVLIGSDLRRLGTCVQLSRQCQRTLPESSVAIGLGWTLAIVAAAATLACSARPGDGRGAAARPRHLAGCWAMPDAC